MYLILFDEGIYISITRIKLLMEESVTFSSKL